MYKCGNIEVFSFLNNSKVHFVLLKTSHKHRLFDCLGFHNFGFLDCSHFPLFRVTRWSHLNHELCVHFSAQTTAAGSVMDTALCFCHEHHLATTLRFASHFRAPSQRGRSVSRERDRLTVPALRD